MPDNSAEDLAFREAADRLAMMEMASVVPGFTPPTQARTRARTGAMLTAAASMLRDRSYADISMADIATAARCSVPAIYARFTNKACLLPAIHLLLLEVYRDTLEERLAPEAFEGRTLQDFARVFVEIVHEFFSTNRNFVRATIVGDSAYVHLQTDHVMGDFTARLNRVLPSLTGRTPEALAPAIESGVRLVVAIFRDQAMIRPYQTKAPTLEGIARIFVQILEADLVAYEPTGT